MAAAAARAVVGAGVVAAALLGLARRLWRARSRSQYDGLDGVVSFSSRLIAAARAAESARPDALFVDPLAYVLAGRRAMAKHETADEADKTAPRLTGPPSSGAPPAGAQAQEGAAAAAAAAAGDAPPRLVPRLVLRTCFFDDATLLATGRPQARAAPVLQPAMDHIRQRGLRPCSQVIMLGAGMDTRPWRLALAPGVRWFEVDRQDVLAAKQSTLKQAGASFAASSSASASDKGGGSGGGGAFPLRAGAWRCATADLQQPGWVQKLLDAGLDPGQPTAWVAEGLLYYLEPTSVGPMFQEAARVSAPGSMIITNFMTEEGLNLLRSASSAARAQQPGAGVGSSSGAAAPGAAGGSAAGAPAAAAAQPPAAAAGGSSSSSSGSHGQQQASSSGGGGGPQQPGPPPSDLQKSGLLAHFRWGCPDDCEQFFADNGWQLLVRHSWQQATKAYGWVPQHTAASRPRTHTQEVQLVVGVVGG